MNKDGNFRISFPLYSDKMQKQAFGLYTSHEATWAFLCDLHKIYELPEKTLNCHYIYI